MSQRATKQPQGKEEGRCRLVSSLPYDSLFFALLQVFAFPFLLPFLSCLFQWHAFVVGVLGGFAAFLWGAVRVAAEISWEGWLGFVCFLPSFPRWSQCHQLQPEEQS